MADIEIFQRIARDGRLVSPGREQARSAFEIVNSHASVRVRRTLGRDVLVKVAREYRLDGLADAAAETDVPGTIDNPY